jgi:hypothetical protein
MERVEPEQPSQVGKPGVDAPSESPLQCRFDRAGEAGRVQDPGERDVERMRGQTIATRVSRSHIHLRGERHETCSK